MALKRATESKIVFSKREEITLEQASKIISALREKNESTLYFDLFCHFVDHFNLDDLQVLMFAEMCGFVIARNAVQIDGE